MHKSSISNIASSITNFTKKEIRKLLYSSRLICKFPQLEIKIAQNTPQDLLGKILIITPKKIGNAPFRNLIRRRVKSIFYENKLYEKKFSWVINCKKEIQDLDFEQLKKIILDCSGKLNNHA